MSNFEVPILTVDDVYDHPNADRLSIVRIRGYEAVAGKLEDGSHRFAKGEPIIYVPEGAIVPDQHLIERGYWSAEKNTGLLAGSKGNRVKAISLRGVLSQGLVWKVKRVLDSGTIVVGYGDPEPYFAIHEKLADLNIDTLGPVMGPLGNRKVQVGDDVADFFGIIKYVPEVPLDMEGRMIGLHESAFDYDIENIKSYPDVFVEGEEVVVTEKLHGTFSRLSFIPGLEASDELFGDGRCVISTKGMGKDGLTFLNIPENAANLYVKFLAPVAQALTNYAEAAFPDAKVHLMGEVFGPGVQDFHYGLREKSFRGFDVFVEGQGFLDEDTKVAVFRRLGIDRVPVLYKGPFERALLDTLVDGKTTITDEANVFTSRDTPKSNIREGVVVTAVGSQEKRELSLARRLRPILKHVSPAYLTRKGGTEYQ